MKVKIIHFSSDSGNREAVAIVAMPPEFDDEDYGVGGMKITESKIVDVDLPDMMPLNETWIKAGV